jgi:hypothetical protein
MKFYAIPPNKHLDMMDNGDSYFCLAHHFLNDESYRNYFTRLRKERPEAFITLDNGAAEESLVTESDLLDAVAFLKPNEVVAPDVLFNVRDTLKNFRSFVGKMEEYGFIKHTSIFACPQGSTKDEWIECYYDMVVDPKVKCVGLSKIAIPACWNGVYGDKQIAESRNQCVEEIYKQKLLLKPVHLLGMGEHTEFEFYLNNKIPNIRSSDSCYTILAAINGINFEKGETTRIPTTNAYFDTILTKEQHNLAKNNIEYLKKKYKDV